MVSTRLLKLIGVLALAGLACGQEQTSKRGFGPNLNTLNASDKVAPWTAKQKYLEATKEAFDYGSFLVAGVFAGLSQLENQFPEYGQGAKGYAKRYGSNFGDLAISTFLTKAVLPAALHEDPRYYRLGQGGFKTRLRYVIGRTFITRKDNGRDGFNYSMVGGSAAAAAASNIYYPAGSRNAANAAQNWGLLLGANTGFNGLREFWPDIRKKVFKSK